MSQTTPGTHPKRLQQILVATAGLAGCVIANPAAAHHPMGGALPSTAWQGLLSGLAHPVIGPDHLAFMLALAAWLAWTRRPASLAAAAIAGFVGLSLVGTALQSRAMAPPGEVGLIAASLLAVAAGLWLRRSPARAWLLAGCTLAGLGHGLAFGEAAIGVEQAPLASYLAGLAAIQGLVMAGVYLLLRQRLGTVGHEAPGAGRSLTRGLAGAAGAMGFWVMGTALLS